ncbi:MAG: SpoIIE family protein phosphatase [Magnetococcales bacterium]|nr:SpoIIE family protein phosphatase [Magnetococcales bacterium]MBF0321796.1 SpoIIE family protein phosphatase [Magnetococcales bacterium]
MDNSIRPEKPRILVVDDVVDNLRILTILLQGDYVVMAAKSGQKALELAHAHPKPDLILLDVMMPEMDGFEVCRRLKEDALTWDIPVIFVTALDEEKDEAYGFKVGGVDYISKPYRPPIIRARVQTHISLQSAVTKLRTQKELLSIERSMVENIILRMRSSLAPASDPHIRTLETPVEKTTGDILLAERRHDGVLHVFLGDFTGHGLSAAVGGPMVVDIFHAMTIKNFSMEEILQEINKKLYKKLPHNLFLAAIFIELTHDFRQIRVWNGGMPSLLIFRQDFAVEEIPPKYFPLGILPEVETSNVIQSATLLPQERIVAFSDGIIEMMDADSQMFGSQRLIDVLRQIFRNTEPLSILEDHLKNFRKDTPQMDDITMVELSSF